jgi:hypothetical protein
MQWGGEGGSALKRIMLFFVVTALMASMVAASALTGSAQNSDRQYNDEAGQYEPDKAPPAPDGDNALYCSPEWIREWGKSQGWWYFWWYKWCHDQDNGWLKVYDSWEWWGPVED